MDEQKVLNFPTEEGLEDLELEYISAEEAERFVLEALERNAEVLRGLAQR